MTRDSDPLARYNAKRDFAKTPEPKGRRGRVRGNGFIVQKHDATRLHYDFRLELDGVLKSWAVTKGPSLDPDDKRLAVRTEDHPLSYGGFEGRIPKGEYGGGTVMLWDRGTWEPVGNKDPRRTIDQGHLHFRLDGERMKGEWLLVRMARRGNEKRENWLLRKIEDSHAGGSDALVGQQLTSIKSGRTMAEIAADAPAISLKGKSGRAFEAAMVQAEKLAGGAARPARRRSARGGRVPAFRAVQLATLVDHVPSGNGWLHEMKYDGYRCLVAVGGGRARIFTRTGLDWTDRFPEIAAAAQKLDLSAGLIDGEIVKLDDKGDPDFSSLQAALSEGGHGLTFFAFDLLSLDGEDLTGLPNITRKERLAALLRMAPTPIVYAEHVLGSGEKLFDAICAAGQEGIVSKKADAPYRGRRTQAWLKAKCTQRQEFVVLGWLPTSAGGRRLRSLILGLNDKDGLRYAGKVGTGFNSGNSDALMARLQRLARKSPPVPAPAAETRGAHWVTPRLVAEIAFAEFTAEGVVRHASFLGLRDDKPAEDITVEAPSEPPAAASRIRISNPDRMIFPEAKVTKGDLAAYYDAMGAAMAPWALNRPISLVRCPQGRSRQCFFQKHDAGSFGDAVKHVDIREKDGKVEPYLYAADIDGLIACVQMGTIEFHGWGASAADVERPDRMVFDLDPDPSIGFDAVKRAARDIRRALEQIGLTSFPMLSGGKGLHVVVPLTPEAEWPEVKDFARNLASAFAEAEPDHYVGTMSKAKRRGRIFIDWLRNQRGATAILPWSVRARPHAPVAAPIAWSELNAIAEASAFTIADRKLLLDRAAGRALSGWGVARQRLPGR